MMEAGWYGVGVTGGVELFGDSGGSVGTRVEELEKDLRDLENCGGREESTEDGMKSEGVGTSDEFIKTLENASAITFAFPSRYSILQLN